MIELSIDLITGLQLYFFVGVVVGVKGCYDVERKRYDERQNTTLTAITILYVSMALFWLPIAAISFINYLTKQLNRFRLEHIRNERFEQLKRDDF